VYVARKPAKKTGGESQPHSQDVDMRDDAADKEVNTTSDAAVVDSQRDTDKSEQNGDCDMEEEAVSADVKKIKKNRKSSNDKAKQPETEASSKTNGRKSAGKTAEKNSKKDGKSAAKESDSGDGVVKSKIVVKSNSTTEVSCTNATTSADDTEALADTSAEVVSMEEKKEVKVVSSFFGTRVFGAVIHGSVKLQLLYRMND
jgi:hypothetical protein